MLDKHPSLNNLKEDKLKLLGLWYHRNCYSIFRNKEHVSRAEKLKLKARETQLVVAEEKGLKPQTPCHHLLRSSIPSSSGSEVARNVHKLPEICIICKKRVVYKMDKVSNACRTAILCFTEDHIYFKKIIAQKIICIPIIRPTKFHAPCAVLAPFGATEKNIWQNFFE